MRWELRRPGRHPNPRPAFIIGAVWEGDAAISQNQHDTRHRHTVNKCGRHIAAHTIRQQTARSPHITQSRKGRMRPQCRSKVTRQT